MADFDITIAGEVNLDLILYGLDEAIPLNREILASNFEMTLGSSSAILAHNLAVLGRRVGFVTLCGSDPMGAIAMERLAESGADLSRCAKGAENTKTGVTILLSHGRSRRILTYPGIMFDMTVAAVQAARVRMRAKCSASSAMPTAVSHARIQTSRAVVDPTARAAKSNWGAWVGDLAARKRTTAP